MSLRGTLSLCVLAALHASCTSGESSARTEVLLQVDADRMIRLQAERMSLDIASGPLGGEMLSRGEVEVFDLTAEEFRWPASLALVAKAGHEQHVFDVTVTVEKGGEALARTRVRSSFLKEQTLLLKTSLFSECIGKLDCADDETCVAKSGQAECVSATIEASRLPAYDPKLGDFPRAGSSAADGGGGQPDAGSDAAQPDAGSGESDGAIAEDAGNDAGADSGTDSGTDSGPAPECVRRGPEQCSNAIDDDCNGDVDCADAACGAMMCSPAGSLTGILVPSSEDCPNGFMAGDMTVYQGLTDMGCAGCSCSTTPTTCSPHVYYYSSTTACTLDSVKPYTGGTLINKPVPQGACNPGEGAPFGEGSIETPVAWRVTMSAYPGTCSASGSASPLPPTWATTMKLCTTKTRGGGCAKGFACVPKVAGKQHCAQPSAASCPASAAKQTWQRGFSDNRSCGLCGCTASGGDCNDVVVNLGHDWGCGAIDSTLHGGEKDCNVSTYAPPAWWSGAPTNATCSSSAPVNGSLTATSPLDLCCVTD